MPLPLHRPLLTTAIVSAMLLAGCVGTPDTDVSSSSAEAISSSEAPAVSSVSSEADSSSSIPMISSSSEAVESSSSEAQASSSSEADLTVMVKTGSILDTEDTAKMCTNRDMRQTADLTEAQHITLQSNADNTITEEGVYVVSGNVTNATIIIETIDEDAKVQLVLQDVTVINQDSPAIYVKAADKVFVTSVGQNHLEVTGAYVPDGETNLDAVIFSRDDLTLNGTGNLTVISAQGNGVTSKDDLKVTGSTITLTSQLDSLEANDSIRICGGDMTINTQKDGLHSENDDDDSLGYIFISGGSMHITAVDDAVRATSVIQMDGGNIVVPTSYEGMEATYLQFNGGMIDVYSRDDGINATAKSTAYPIVIEVNDGMLYVEVGSGDTDCFDSNGDIYVNGGYISVTGNSAFDRDGTAVFNGGTVFVNGTQVTTLPGMGGGRGF